MEMYEQTAPSGVKVVSSVPFHTFRWWDSPWLHIVWSYMSWGTWIIQDVSGWDRPRRWFTSSPWFN